MIKKNLVKTVMLGMCLSLFSAGAALAETADGSQIMKISTPFIAEEPEGDLEILQKEIDDYVFLENYKELEDRGFMTTSTGITDNYVEISIAPYSEENADFLYELFGRDSVKVVEGVEAVLYTNGEAAPFDSDTASKAEEGTMTTQVIDEALIEKLEAVSKILLEEKADQLKDEGISILYISPMESSLEVGILPFTPETADFVSELIGDDSVRIVEDMQPELVSEEEAIYTITGLDTEADIKTNNILPVVIAGIAGAAGLLGAAVYAANKKKNAN